MAGFRSVGMELFHFARALLAIALASQSFFRATLLTRLQVKRVPLDFFYDVFLLNFPLKTAQRTFKSFSLLQMNFCQLTFTTFRVRSRDLPQVTS